MSAAWLSARRRAAERALEYLMAAMALACDWWPLIVAPVILVALMGCAGVQTAPSTVKVAVAQGCPTQMPPRPTFPADTLTGDEDLWTLGTTLWADRKARKAWELDIEARLAGCIDPPGEP